jgi:hypothetical protein
LIASRGTQKNHVFGGVGLKKSCFQGCQPQKIMFFELFTPDVSIFLRKSFLTNGFDVKLSFVSNTFMKNAFLQHMN